MFKFSGWSRGLSYNSRLLHVIFLLEEYLALSETTGDPPPQYPCLLGKSCNYAWYWHLGMMRSSHDGSCLALDVRGLREDQILVDWLDVAPLDRRSSQNFCLLCAAQQARYRARLTLCLTKRWPCFIKNSAKHAELDLTLASMMRKA